MRKTVNEKPTPALPKGGSLITCFYFVAIEVLGNCHTALRRGIQKRKSLSKEIGCIAICLCIYKKKEYFCILLKN